MIDVGLLLSLVAAVGLPLVVANRWWPLHTHPPTVGIADLAVVPAMAGLLVGRLVAVALDDPRSLTSPPDLIVIRSGVELWPGVVAAVAVLWWQARRDQVPVVPRLADAAPFALLAYAAYEGTCHVRGGCFGPAAPIGLRPPGLTGTQVPVGMLMALAVVIGAVAVRRHLDRAAPAPPGTAPGAWAGPQPSARAARTQAALTLAGAVAVVAAVRAVGSIWLPHVGAGLTRQHLTSIMVALGAALALLGLVRWSRRQHGENADDHP